MANFPFDRLPNHPAQAEQCLLASMMLDVSQDAVGQIVRIVRPADFVLASHRTIFITLSELHDARSPIDAMIVRERLVDTGQLDSIGGIEYLAEILSSVPNAADGIRYAQIVRDAARRRGAQDN